MTSGVVLTPFAARDKSPSKRQVDAHRRETNYLIAATFPKRSLCPQAEFHCPAPHSPDKKTDETLQKQRTGSSAGNPVRPTAAAIAGSNGRKRCARFGRRRAAQKSSFPFAGGKFAIDGRFAIDHIRYVAASYQELHYLFAFTGQLRPSGFRFRVLF